MSSTKGLAVAVSVLLVLVTIARAGLALAVRSRRNAVDRLFADGAIRAKEVLDADQVVSRVSTIQLTLFLATAVLVAIWSYKVAVNARKLQASVDVKPGWAAATWFLPIAFFIAPFIFLGRVSDACRRPGESKTNGALLAWWGAFVAMIAVSWAFRDTKLDSAIGRTALADRLDSQVNHVSIIFAVSVVAAIAAILAVRGISARQDELAATRR
jgi:hypothetical protein